mmetsp:Transcript_22796/g.71428  ORF Transcript_22796/g.71428 Transcript_22796/m.71428 type:complete len:284 (+) Transcript_22796:282-1133(+)
MLSCRPGLCQFARGPFAVVVEVCDLPFHATKRLDAVSEFLVDRRKVLLLHNRFVVERLERLTALRGATVISDLRHALTAGVRLAALCVLGVAIAFLLTSHSICSACPHCAILVAQLSSQNRRESLSAKLAYPESVDWGAALISVIRTSIVSTSIPEFFGPLFVRRHETSPADSGGKWENTRKTSKLLALNEAIRPCLLCELSERFVERQPAVEIASFSRTPFSRSASPSALTLNKYSRSITALPACTSYDLFTPATPSLCGISPSSWNTIVSTTTPSPGSGAW